MRTELWDEFAGLISSSPRLLVPVTAHNPDNTSSLTTYDDTQMRAMGIIGAQFPTTCRSAAWNPLPAFTRPRASPSAYAISIAWRRRAVTITCWQALSSMTVAKSDGTPLIRGYCEGRRASG